MNADGPSHIQHPLLNWLPISTPFGADFITCPGCGKMFENKLCDDEGDDELEYIFSSTLSRCPKCKLCFGTGCVFERWGCTDDTYFPIVYVKKLIPNELLYHDPERKLTDKILNDEYDSVCLCVSVRNIASDVLDRVDEERND
jgi:hypothetical protein